MSVIFNVIGGLPRRPTSGPFHPPVLISLGLFFELVFPESTSEGGRPHVQGRPGGQGEEEEEGHLETEPVHHASGQGAERQLPQNLQSRQETVVGRLEERGGRGKRRKSKERQRDGKAGGGK